MAQRKTDPLVTIRRDVNELKARVKSLETARPGRKPLPLIATKQLNVCAIDPSRDSRKCNDASIYRYQNGCWGSACRLMQHEAYERRKEARAARARKLARAKVAAPVKKTVSKRPTTKKATPMTARKRVIKKAPSKRVAKAS